MSDNEYKPLPGVDYVKLAIENGREVARLLDAEEGWMETQKELSDEVKRLRDRCAAYVTETAESVQREEADASDLKRCGETIKRLREALEDCQRLSMMACEEPASDCQCSGCALVNEENAEDALRT